MKKHELSAKKWTILTLTSAVLILALFAAVTFIIDPLLYFRSNARLKDSGMITYWFYNQLYSGPGVARQYDYDTVITGSSMVVDFDTTDFDALYNAKTVKLTYNEATAHNDKAILDICFETHPDLKRVFMPIDSFTCIHGADQYNFPLPEYMYAKSPENSVKYLLNLNIFYHITFQDIVGTLRGKTKDAMQSKPEYLQHGSEWVRSYQLTPWEEIENHDTTDYLSNTDANLAENILPLIAAHPDTEFVFFTPPYSMLFWYNRMGSDDAEACLESMRKTVAACLQYDNVKIYGFGWDETITTDLDNYRDTAHFSPEIHSELAHRMSDDSDRITLDNYNELFDRFIARVKTFDYEKLYNSYAADD